MEEIVQKVYDFLNIPENKNLKEFVKTFHEPNGFAYCTKKEYMDIMNGIDEDCHSGVSLASCLRTCQKLFNLESQNI